MIELIPEKIGTLPALTSQALKSPKTARTAKDGSFRVTGLVPGGYVVRISTGRAGMKSPVTDFSREDEDAVDEGVGTSWWAGAAERESASIVTVNPAAVTTLGSSIGVHKQPLYRIHFIPQGCQPADEINLQGPGSLPLPNGVNTQDLPMFMAAGRANFSCKGVLIPGFRRGSYRFTATTKHSAALADVTITDRNVTVPLSLIPNGDMLGRIVTAEGSPPPSRRPPPQLPKSGLVVPDSDGNFILTDVPCIPAPLGMRLLFGAPGYYVKEIRVNGVVAAQDALPLCAGSRLEIVLDNKVASLTVALSEVNTPASERIIAVEKSPRTAVTRPTPPPDQSGSVHYTNLEPGDYRVLALRKVALPDGEDLQQVIPQLWDRAAKITLGPGDAKSVSVKLIDPFDR